VWNIGCIGPEGVDVALDSIVCLVGKNNAGKSTILRAYELAHSPEKYDPKRDRCHWCPADQTPVVELEIHIPKGTANIDEKWKEARGDLLILRSRWEWDAAGDFVRRTWNPAAGEWSVDGNAGGASNVFKSRLPRPLRIGSLEDADKTEEVLLALVLGPLVDEMIVHQSDPNSALSQTVGELTAFVSQLAESHEKRFEKVASNVHRSFSNIFPQLDVRLDVAMAAPTIQLKKLLEEGSGLRVLDGKAETSLAQQGTGARRALFWSMLQVHNKLKRDQDQMTDLRKRLGKAKKDEEKSFLEAKIQALQSGDKLPTDEDDPALPGYLLLLDEPENGLHPMASRKAQQHLYRLADDPDWQVMLTTHSPFFVNPLEDHTTIVRLERSPGKDGTISTKTFRAREVEFDSITKRNLQAIQNMDVGFSEIFFGSYPILVEGDTEHAAFLAAIIESNHELAGTATVVRARGKAILPAIIRMLRHFHLPFSIIHDIDWPYTSAGTNNGMWTINKAIHDEVTKCRDSGLPIRHHCSVPDFERLLGGAQLGKDKPLEAYQMIRDNELARETVVKLIESLYAGKQHQPFGFDPQGEHSYLDTLLGELTKWSQVNGFDDDIRLLGRDLHADNDTSEAV
jgi:putative ATP-dependent endonuclease of the OLD family